jgi:uncharacterized membrane protein YkvA (DUF1232 family)
MLPLMRRRTWLNLRSRARALKTETLALYLACRDPRVPWYAKALGAAVVGYALSPIDLIPDFIPVLGYLDDLILIPAGIALLIRLVPAAVMAEMRERAGREFAAGMPKSLAAALVVSAWIAAVGIAAWLVLSRVLPR